MTTKILAMNTVLYNIEQYMKEVLLISRASWVVANGDASLFYARSTMEKMVILKEQHLSRVWSAWSEIHGQITKHETRVLTQHTGLSTLVQSARALEDLMIREPDLTVEEAIEVLRKDDAIPEPMPRPIASVPVPVPIPAPEPVAAPEPVPITKLNYKHHFWPSPRPKLFAKKLGAKVRGHEDSLKFLAEKAGITVDALLQMNPLLYEDKYMWPKVVHLGKNELNALFGDLGGQVTIRRKRWPHLPYY